MTPAERQRRHRAKLAAIVEVAPVLKALRRDYYRLRADDKPRLRR
jgi:hypothetical protein